MKTLYGDYSDAISDWNNMLGQDRFDRFSIRKQLVRAYFYKYGSSWERLPIKELNRMIDLMIQNLEEKPGDERTIYMWINAIRYISQPPNWDSLIEKLTYWKIQAENKLEATYYLFIMHFYKAISGSNSSKSQLIKLSEDLSHLSRTLKDRHLSREWLGNGDDIRSLIKSSRLGSYDPITDFWENTSLLRRFEGRIKKITAIDKGYIDFDVNVSAYFVPIKSGMRSGRDENKRVTCYIGFSYDGLRAWEVKFCD